VRSAESPGALHSATELGGEASPSKRHPGWQAGLPWGVYGEGEAPDSWRNQTGQVCPQKRENSSVKGIIPGECLAIPGRKEGVWVWQAGRAASGGWGWVGGGGQWSPWPIAFQLLKSGDGEVALNLCRFPIIDKHLLASDLLLVSMPSMNDQLHIPVFNSASVGHWKQLSSFGHWKQLSACK